MIQWFRACLWSKFLLKTFIFRLFDGAEYVRHIIPLYNGISIFAANQIAKLISSVCIDNVIHAEKENASSYFDARRCNGKRHRLFGKRSITDKLAKTENHWQHCQKCLLNICCNRFDFNETATWTWPPTNDNFISNWQHSMQTKWLMQPLIQLWVLQQNTAHNI